MHEIFGGFSQNLKILIAWARRMMMQNETSQNKMLLSSDYYLKRWYNSVVRDGLQADRWV